MKKREVTMIIVACVLICGQVFFDLKIPEYIDQMTVMCSALEANLADIWIIGAQMLGCLLASLILSVITGYLSAKAAAGFTFTLRKILFNKVMDFSDEEVHKFGVPSLITRTTNDITQIQTLISMGLQIAVKAPIMAVWALCKILGQSWQLSLLTAVFVFVVCLSVIIVMFIVLPRFRKIQKLTDKINMVVRENLTGINVVHAFNAEKYQNEKFEEVNNNITKTQLFNQRVFSVLQPLIELATSGLWFSIYWLGAALLIPMALTERILFFGNIVAFAMYANFVLMAFMMMVMIFMMIPPAQASAERIVEVIETKISIHEGGEAITIDSDNILEFRDVYFKYPNNRENMLKDINFSVKRGQTLAIIGTTGSGKSTLANLIARFYNPSNGKIFLDGKNIGSYTFDALYDKVCLATQKPVVFYGSIKENINFGKQKQKLTDKDIDKALEISQAKDFVDKLDEGINSTVSQGGKDISGGQKQRLSIARAIARKPEILVLDDTFSALDYKTDAMLRKELRANLKDTTLIIIAQRIGTIKNADKILVLENGKLVGQGTHNELLKTCMTYQEIAISQMKADELAQIK